MDVHIYRGISRMVKLGLLLSANRKSYNVAFVAQQRMTSSDLE